MLFPEFEYFLLDFSHFSRNFPINKKSRKSLLHKAFLDFILEIFLEIVFVCVVQLKTAILIFVNIRKSIGAADFCIKRILCVNVSIIRNDRLEESHNGKNNYMFAIKNQLFAKIITSILAIILEKD